MSFQALPEFWEGSSKFWSIQWNKFIDITGELVYVCVLSNNQIFDN
jgi:hypothetical protein